MKRVLVAIILCMFACAACRQNSLPALEGRVVDATIYSVTVETPAGDSVAVSTLGTNPMLVPGVLPGDEVRIWYELLPDGQTLRARELDIISPSAFRLLPGIWRDCTEADEVGLVLAEDGSARATGLPEPLQDWSLDGDLLALTAVENEDPKITKTLLYRIDRLDVDSLVAVPVGGGRTLSFSRQQ